MEEFVLYYRVSTRRQGVSGLGLQAQETTMENYLRSIKDYTVLGRFQDVESGKNDLRPNLTEAIKLAKKQNARLLIATLDRLSRNLVFIATLMENQVKFTACDIPEANELTIHIFAAIAQWERKRIGERTRKAVAEARKNGAKIGNPECFTNEGRYNGGDQKRKAAQNNERNLKAYQTITAYIRQVEDWNFKSLAKFLNEIPLQTSTGSAWSARAIKNLIKLYENKNQSKAA